MLFSIDLEDVRLMVPGGERFRDAVPDMTRRYLDFLDTHRGRATFFVVGRVALRHPDLVAEIQARGHEIACHSHDHVPLHQLGSEVLRVPAPDGDVMAKVLGQVALGDLVSVEVAARRGVDPCRVDAIQRLKATLASRRSADPAV